MEGGKMKQWALVASLLLNVVLIALLVVAKVAPSDDSSSRVNRKSAAYHVTVNNGDIVFMGEDRFADCSWPFFLANDKVKNLAIDRNTIREDINRMDMVFDGVQPAQFFLMYGEEELLSGKTVGEAATDYANLLGELKKRFPATEVVVVSTLPISNPTDNEFNIDMSDKIQKLNMLVKSYAYKYDYPFLDVQKEFTDASGGLVLDYGGADGFNLSHVGYVILKSRIKDYLK